MKLSSLSALKVVKVTTFSAASDKKIIKMTTFFVSMDVAFIVAVKLCLIITSHESTTDWICDHNKKTALRYQAHV